MAEKQRIDRSIGKHHLCWEEEQWKKKGKSIHAELRNDPLMKIPMYRWAHERLHKTIEPIDLVCQDVTYFVIQSLNKYRRRKDALYQVTDELQKFAESNNGNKQDDAKLLAIHLARQLALIDVYNGYTSQGFGLMVPETISKIEKQIVTL